MSNGDISAEEAQAQRCNDQASLETVHDFFHSAASACGDVVALLGCWQLQPRGGHVKPWLRCQGLGGALQLRPPYAFSAAY